MKQKFLKLMGISLVIAAFVVLVGGIGLYSDPPGISTNVKLMRMG